ncbi:MAG: hypothetical protein IIX72_02155 [Oscillospiraceae bacterium]|jgi:hypothetical protein|nr:hypothetical protein [Oscillospiraceae bacterium]
MSDKRVEIFIPRQSDREDPNLFVGINGVNYLLPRGKKSMVPQSVAAEIERSGRAADVFYENVDGMKNSGN